MDFLKTIKYNILTFYRYVLNLYLIFPLCENIIRYVIYHITPFTVPIKNNNYIIALNRRTNI